MIGGKDTQVCTVSNLYSKKAIVITNVMYSVIILYKLPQIKMAQLQVLKDVLRLTDGKLSIARSFAVHVCDGRRPFLTCTNYRVRW